MSNYMPTTLRSTYQLTCPQSHSDDFESNLDRFECENDGLKYLRSQAEMLLRIEQARQTFGVTESIPEVEITFTIEEGKAFTFTGPQLRDVLTSEYQNWLQNGNCPPPRPPQVAEESQVATEDVKGEDSSGGTTSSGTAKPSLISEADLEALDDLPEYRPNGGKQITDAVLGTLAAGAIAGVIGLASYAAATYALAAEAAGTVTAGAEAVIQEAEELLAA